MEAMFLLFFEVLDQVLSRTDGFVRARTGGREGRKGDRWCERTSFDGARGF